VEWDLACVQLLQSGARIALLCRQHTGQAAHHGSIQ
jgi:hypothetical protein